MKSSKRTISLLRLWLPLGVAACRDHICRKHFAGDSDQRGSCWQQDLLAHWSSVDSFSDLLEGTRLHMRNYELTKNLWENLGS